MFSSAASRTRVTEGASFIEVMVGPPGLRWPIALRLVVVAVFLLPCIGDPRGLPWDRLAFGIFWVLMTLGLLIHTVRLACKRCRLRLDPNGAELVSTTLFEHQRSACSIGEFQLGHVDLLRSEEGADAADTYCLRLCFGPEQVEAFIGHDEPTLARVRERLLHWLTEHVRSCPS
jgi:hypothetical protein